MALRNIVKEGDDILNKKCRPVQKFDKKLAILLEDMAETMRNANGVGLAAPQIGVSLRVLIVDGDVMTDVYDCLAGFKRVMINPVILESSNHGCEYSEGCLSVPGIYADVTRPDSITIEYYDENFQKQTEKLDKFACRMVQHEMSHLDGVLFTDLVPPIRKKMLSKKLFGISKGKVSPRYNYKIK